LLLDGAPFVPRGVQVVGLVAPAADIRPFAAGAHRHFGGAELRKAISYHVNTIRFQVSEFGLDPRDSLFSRSYLAQVAGAVRLARRLGLTVILTVQAEPPAGRPQRCPLPDAGALRVWNELAPMFGSDRRVLFELYNEPDVPATPAGWQAWRKGGRVSGGGVTCTAVGMQTLIDAIRSDGAHNVIIVPGAHFERTIAGMPALTDPGSPSDPQLIYGIHDPALFIGAAGPKWPADFGTVSSRVPVIVTEWNASSTADGCNPDAPSHAPMLLDYLAAHRIGVVGYSFDLPGTIITGWSYRPTSYRGFACGKEGAGPGRLLFGTFAAAAAGGSP